MASTKNDVRDIAATELGLIGLDQSLQHQDSVELLRRYDEVYAELKDRGLATWAASGSVPTELVPHVAAMVAFAAADLYGLSDRRYARLQIKNARARRQIRRLTQPRYESTNALVNF